MVPRAIASRTLGDGPRALDDFDAVVERALKRLPKTRIARALVAVAAPMPGSVLDAMGPEMEGADRS